jgi:hypothetical protein
MAVSGSVSKHLLTGVAVFLVIGAAGVLILSPHLFKAKQFPVPYLLPVSFYSGQVNNFGMDKIQTINRSRYHEADKWQIYRQNLCCCMIFLKTGHF